LLSRVIPEHCPRASVYGKPKRSGGQYL